MHPPPVITIVHKVFLHGNGNAAMYVIVRHRCDVDATWEGTGREQKVVPAIEEMISGFSS